MTREEREEQIGGFSGDSAPKSQVSAEKGSKSTPDPLHHLRETARAATPRHWYIGGSIYDTSGRDRLVAVAADHDDPEATRRIEVAPVVVGMADAEFIATWRNAAPAILRVLEAAKDAASDDGCWDPDERVVSEDDVTGMVAVEFVACGKCLPCALSALSGTEGGSDAQDG